MYNRTFISLQVLSQCLGLPKAWLSAQAKIGHIPSLRAGRRLMFYRDEVEAALLKRSRDEHGVQVSDESETQTKPNSKSNLS